jgi:nickel transport protein
MRRLAALLVPLLLAAAPAAAHKLKVFAAVEGAEAVGSAYYVGGEKAAGVPGRILGADGSLVATFATGPDGTFRQKLAARMDHTILVESEDGHAATFTIRADELPQTLAEAKTKAAAIPADTAAAEASIEAAVARQIRPLREQLDAYESRTRVHDVMGGIGTIFGLFGLWAWLRSRRGGGS